MPGFREPIEERLLIRERNLEDDGPTQPTAPQTLRRNRLVHRRDTDAGNLSHADFQHHHVVPLRLYGDQPGAVRSELRRRGGVLEKKLVSCRTPRRPPGATRPGSGRHGDRRTFLVVMDTFFTHIDPFRVGYGIVQLFAGVGTVSVLRRGGLSVADPLARAFGRAVHFRSHGGGVGGVFSCWR